MQPVVTSFSLRTCKDNKNSKTRRKSTKKMVSCLIIHKKGADYKDNVIFVLPKFKETGLWTRKSESFL